MVNLPGKTIERLSIYRRILYSVVTEGRKYIFSHDLAKLIHIKPEQVRKDLMLISHTSVGKKGYDVVKLIQNISKIIDPKTKQSIALVGLGNLGKAILSYFNGKRSQLVISAVFDIDPDKVGKVYAGVRCYSFDQIQETINNEGITMAIITVPADQTEKVAESLVRAGIKGILNYTQTPINVEPFAYLEEYDMITSIEKVAYFSKKYKS